MNQKQKEHILAVVKGKLSSTPACPLCGQKDWTLDDQFVIHQLQEDTKSFQIGGPGYPCVALICKNCGNTHFLNVIVLGLGDLLKPEDPQEKKK